MSQEEAFGLWGAQRELLTYVWVWEGYLEYRQVPDSDLARCESPGLCGDQQVSSHRVSAQGQ